MDARDYDLVSFPPRFRSKEVEGRFRDEDARATLPNLRGLSILSLIIVVVFDFTDALFAEEVLGSLRLIRFGGSFPIVAGFFALTFWRGFPRSRDVILPLAFALCWATVVALLTVFPNTVDLAALGWTGAGTGPIPLADGKLFFLMGFVLTMLFGGVAGGVVAFRPSAVIALGTVPVILIGQRLLGASVFSLAFGAFSTAIVASIAVYTAYQFEGVRRQDWRRRELEAVDTLQTSPARESPSWILPSLSGPDDLPLEELMDLGPDAPPLRRPRIGRYEILTSLGRGGTASVYLVRAPGVDGIGRPMALKRLRLAAERGDLHFRSLLNEARLLSRLSHPNLVQAYGLEEIDGALCMLMEYVEGTSLAQLIAARRWGRGGLPSADVALIAIRVCAGLTYVHGQLDEDGAPLALVHRDIKPANILLAAGGEVKIVDFGIAKSTLGEDSTFAGMLKGTLAYMSPEQVRGEGVDPRSDLFSLGLVIYEALTLEAYLPREDLASLVLELGRGFRPDARARIEAEAPEWAEILERLLAADPAQRFPGAAALAAAIEAAIPPSSPDALRRTLDPDGAGEAPPGAGHSQAPDPGLGASR